MLGSRFVDGRYGFLLRCLSRGGVPDLEFDGVSRMLPRSDSFNGKDLTFGESLGGPQSCISAMEPRRARVRR